MNLQFAIPRATFAEAIAAVRSLEAETTKKIQAQLQSDRDALSRDTANGGAQRISVGGLSYIWTETPLGKDRGFWMLESSAYQALESGERLTLSIQEMAAKLIAAGEIANPAPAPMPREDEIARFVWPDPYRDRDPGDETDHYVGRESIVTNDQGGIEALEDGGPTYGAGDVVVLRSGSPDMTVYDIHLCDEGCCVTQLDVMWFDEKAGCIKRDFLKPEIVEHVWSAE